MFKKSEKGYYFWEEFSKIDGLVHGFSTRKFGDMNWKNKNSIKSLKLFCDALQIEPNKTVRMKQVHGNNVRVIDYRTSIFRHSGKRRDEPDGASRSTSRISMVQRDSGQDGYQTGQYHSVRPSPEPTGSGTVTRQARMTWVDSTDGLISFQKGVFLVVTFADCVPALFLDKNKKFLGIAHAGWKGAYKEIVKVVVLEMVKKGSDPSDIMVGLGPSIRECCYDIKEERETVFKSKFPKMKNITTRRNSKIFLDLLELIKLQLKDCGILSKNILDCGVCTKDNILDFYSFRKEGGTESFGLSSGVIGRI